jgi:hypothetical protein
MSRGGIVIFTLKSFDPILACAKPPSMSRGGVHDIEEKRIELETQQMTA